MMRPTQTAALICTALLLAHSGARAGEEEISLKEGVGRDLVARNCVLCHSLDYIPMNAPVMTDARWEATVRKMIDKMGAPIGDADAKQIVQYLATSYSAAK
jgi:mono/diheme cytochrome c family protein